MRRAAWESNQVSGEKGDELRHAVRLGIDGGAIKPTMDANPSRRRSSFRLKRVTDVVLATVAIILLAPLLVVIGLLVWLESGRPIIFKQRRHGLNDKVFEVLKFRTMYSGRDAQHGDGAEQTRRKDARVTRVGYYLRTTSLDELPQLFNVLFGSMSMVGPRPHPVVMLTEGRLCEEIVPEYNLRHQVKPGITGWAQVNGFRGATETTEQLVRRVECDIYYVENWSYRFDWEILLKTPYLVISQRENAF